MRAGVDDPASVRCRFGVGPSLTFSFLTATLLCGGKTGRIALAAVLPFWTAGVEVAIGIVAVFGACFGTLRFTVLPSTAPRIASRSSMYSQMNFQTVMFRRRSVKCSRRASRRALMSPSSSSLFRVSEYMEMSTVTATISTGAKVCTPRKCLSALVNVSESCSISSLKVFHTLAKWDFVASSTTSVLLKSFGREL